MPYIDKAFRARAANSPLTAGELNYAITMLVQAFMNASGGLSYSNVNTVVGALECAKLELYRRLAVPYEDQKCAQNGDAYHISTKSTTPFKPTKNLTNDQIMKIVSGAAPLPTLPLDDALCNALRKEGNQSDHSDSAHGAEFPMPQKSHEIPALRTAIFDVVRPISHLEKLTRSHNGGFFFYGAYTTKTVGRWYIDAFKLGDEDWVEVANCKATGTVTFEAGSDFVKMVLVDWYYPKSAIPVVLFKLKPFDMTSAGKFYGDGDTDDIPL